MFSPQQAHIMMESENMVKHTTQIEFLNGLSDELTQMPAD